MLCYLYMVHGTWRRAQGAGRNCIEHVTWHQAAAGRTRCYMLHAICAMLHICCVVHGSQFMAWFMGVGPWATLLYVRDRSVVPPVCRMPYAVCRMPSEANAVDKVQKWLDHRSCVAHRYTEKACTVGVCAGEGVGAQNSGFWQLQHAQHITGHWPLAVTHYPTCRRSLCLAHAHIDSQFIHNSQMIQPATSTKQKAEGAQSPPPVLDVALLCMKLIDALFLIPPYSVLSTQLISSQLSSHERKRTHTAHMHTHHVLFVIQT